MANQQPPNAPDQQVTFDERWEVLGPFQIGTREAPWGADPLELYGGFRHVQYDNEASFRSSIGANGTVGWSKHTARIPHSADDHATAELSVGFPEFEEDWSFLQSVYGWAALQWQGWARGEIVVPPGSAGVFALHTEGILECLVDDVHYYGGDFYGYGRAPVTLRLEPGSHRIDIRLVRDVRAFGAVGAPTVDVKLRVVGSSGGLELLYGYGKNVLMSEVVGGTWGQLASPYASVTVRDDAESDIYVHSIEGMGDRCVIEMLSREPVKLVPRQTRPVGFKIACTPSYDKNLHLQFHYTVDGAAGMRTRSTSVWPQIVESTADPHRVTFMHPGGMVSYAILRPPSSSCGKSVNVSLPVLLALHGAGLEADDPLVRHALDDLEALCAWVLFPTGATPWSGDDWHIWGWADVEASIAMIPDWIKQVEWSGPGVDISRLFVAGHSNGGQGAWYALTHHFDRIEAAAPLSAYSSIQNYVPYTFWRTADPARMAVVHASMNSYRHDLLIENAKGIPVLIQHGSADDNVPVYHSRLMSERLVEAGIDSRYYEMEGRPHYWDGVMATKPLSDFFTKHLHASDSAQPSPRLASFTMVVANPAEAGLKLGIKVFHLMDPGRLGRLEVVYDQLSGKCSIHTSNILVWIMPQDFLDCDGVLLDGQIVHLASDTSGDLVWHRKGKQWELHDSVQSATVGSPMRDQNQLGHMDAILRTKGPFNIVRHTAETAHVALQVSRNLNQYFAADTIITDDYDTALKATGNVISIVNGPSLPGDRLHEHPIEIENGGITVLLDAPYSQHYDEIDDHGLGAIFLRPLLNGRLELVVWGKDERSLAIAARLVPMVPGSGQPDFVVVDDRMLGKGVEGTRAMGSFDAWWNVTRSSFLG